MASENVKVELRECVEEEDGGIRRMRRMRKVQMETTRRRKLIMSPRWTPRNCNLIGLPVAHCLHNDMSRSTHQTHSFNPPRI